MRQGIEHAPLKTRVIGTLSAAALSFIMLACGDAEPTVFPDAQAGIAALDIDASEGKLDKDVVSADARGALNATAMHLEQELASIYTLFSDQYPYGESGDYVSRSYEADGVATSMTSHDYIDEDGIRNTGFTMTTSFTDGTTAADKYPITDRGMYVNTGGEDGPRIVLYTAVRELDRNGDVYTRRADRLSITPDEFRDKWSFLDAFAHESGEDPSTYGPQFSMNDFDGLGLGSNNRKQKNIDTRAELVANGLQEAIGFLAEAQEAAAASQ